MKRLVYASHSKNKLNNMQPGTWINKVGKYLKDHIDGAYKIAFNSMECEIFMRMYYQIPEVAESFDEMKFIISITSYQNKLRINLTEDNEMEKTIGQIVLQPEELGNLEHVRLRVLKMIRKAIDKEFDIFDFVY